MYKVGKKKEQKLKVATEIAKTFLNVEYDFKKMDKNDFIALWEISKVIVEMEERYKEDSEY